MARVSMICSEMHGSGKIWFDISTLTISRRLYRDRGHGLQSRQLNAACNAIVTMHVMLLPMACHIDQYQCQCTGVKTAFQLLMASILIHYTR